MSSNNAKYMPGIDGLRTLAVVAVVFYHLNFPFMPGGFLGVTLFFVLSGYLITDLLLNEWDVKNKISLGNFWARRAKRLLPGLFTFLILLGGFITIFRPELMGKLIPDLIPAIFYYSNWWNIFHQVSYFQSFDTAPLLNHLWSLAVEEQFYIIWPLLLLIGLKIFRNHKRILVGVILLGALISAGAMSVLYVAADPSRSYFGTDTRIFSLLIGAATAFILPSIRLQSIKLAGARLIAMNITGIIGITAFLAFAIFSNQYGDFLYKGGMLLFSFFCVLLIISAVNRATLISKFFGIPPLSYIGKFSYEIYLFQFPVIVLTSPEVNTNGINLGLSFLQIALTLILAWLVYFFVTNPIRYGKVKKNHPIGSGLKYGAIIVFAIITIFGVVNARPAETDSLAQISEKKPKKHATKTPKPKTSPNPQQKDTPEPVQLEPGVLSDKKITVIGDSIMINIEPYLTDSYPNMDFNDKVAFQIYNLQDKIQEIKRESNLGDIVIIELGTNGTCSKSTLIDAISEIGSEHKIIFCSTRSPRGWVSDFNQKLKEVISIYPNTILADWYSISANHDEFFVRDGVHPTSAGSNAYKQMLQNAIQLALQN